jgi:L-threonylcarbamoyladenylate synthase
MVPKPKNLPAPLILPAATALDEAARLVLAGEPVAVPTETVYGLAADATNGAAVARIYEIKDRPRFNPLIVHVADMAMAERLAVFPPLARRLADAFWPGALTLVLPRAPGSPVHELVTAGLETVAVRMPKGFAATLIAATGKPLAAPSANISGRLSPTSAAAVAKGLASRVALIADDGVCAVGLESTIVKAGADGKLTLLRPGGIVAREIEKVAGTALERPVPADRVEAPGMLESHYAPQAPLRMNAQSVEPGEGLLAFGPIRVAGADKAAAIVNLSPSGDLREAAATLFAALAALDTKAGRIACEAVPMEGLGEAINDRLARAAAPRGDARHP